MSWTKLGSVSNRSSGRSHCCADRNCFHDRVIHANEYLQTVAEQSPDGSHAPDIGAGFLHRREIIVFCRQFLDLA